MSFLKMEILRYLYENDSLRSVDELIDALRNNANFEDIEREKIEKKLREMRNEDLIRSNLRPKLDNNEVINRLSFILWSRHRNISWQDLLAKNCVSVFSETLKRREASLQELIEATGLSQPTVSKYIRVLEENGLIKEIKGRPLIVRALVNDRSLFYINLFDLDLTALEDEIPSLETSKEIDTIEEEVAKIHIFSSTKTEGNTASERDVEKVLEDLKLHDLRATEVVEIKDMQSAIESLRKIFNQPITVEKIQTLNGEVLKGTKENSGELQGGQDIQGADYTPPENLKTVRCSLRGMCNLVANKGNLKPEILGGILHFLFVSIHPFIDGNGRTGRLLHSWILIREDKPLFIYDPRLQDEYFEVLGIGNEEDLQPFLEFAVREHQQQLDRLEGVERDKILEKEKENKTKTVEDKGDEETSLTEF